MSAVRRDDATLATFAGLAAVAASYLVAGLGRSFVVIPIDRFIVNLVPGRIIAEVVVRVGTLGHILHQGPALLIGAGLFGLLSYGGLALARRTDSRIAGALAAGLAGLLLAGLLTSAWTLAFGPGIALAAVTGLAPVGGTGLEPVSVERRSVLRGAAGALTLLGAGAYVNILIADDEPPAPLSEGTEAVATLQDTAADRAFDIEGLKGMISGNHYEVDINSFSNPTVSTDTWSLSVTGQVETPVEYTHAELRDLSQEHRIVTLRCVSDELNGDLMDTAVWSGVPASEVLDAASPESDCGCVMLYGVDGYYVEFPLAALRRGLLAYGMNGRFLPEGHGYPLRALVPGHWGEVNAKWLEEIEVLDKPAEGYWESPPRNWQGTGIVTTIAKLSVSRRLSSGDVLLAGHAYAGTRGIERVEVSIDDGNTWMTADLSEPLPGNDTWRQWRLQYEQSGSATALVRAVDGTGTVQPRERSDPYPSGASGWVSQRVP